MDATTPTGIATNRPSIAEAQAAYTTWHRFQTRLEPLAMEAFRDVQALVRVGLFNAGVPESAYRMYSHPLNRWLQDVSYVTFDTDEGLFIAQSNHLDDGDTGGSLTITQVLDGESRAHLADDLVEQALQKYVKAETRRQDLQRESDIATLRRLAAQYPEEVPNA